MAANEVNIRVNVGTRDAEKQTKSLKDSLMNLVAPLKSIAGLAGVAGVGGVLLLGRSFISTAVQAGAGSQALWRFQEASFELRRTIGELLLKALGPLMDTTAKFFTLITKVVDGINVFVWRNWETIMEGIRGSLASLDTITGGFGSRLGEITRQFKEQGGVAAVWAAVLGIAARNLEVVNAELDKLNKRFKPILEAFSSIIPLLGPLAVPLLIIKKLFEDVANANLDWIGVLARFITKIFPVTRALEMLAGFLSFVNLALDVLGVAWNFTWNLMRSVFFGVWGSIRSTWFAVWGFLSKWFIKGLELVSDTWGTVWENMRDFFVGIWDGISKAWETTWNGMKDFVSTLWAAIKTRAVDAWTGIKDAIIGIVNTLIRKINDFINFWNNIEFRTPRISFGFGDNRITIPSRTFGTPDIGNIPTLARGGVARSGGLAIVGERGPELLSMEKGAQVTPLSGAGGGLTIHYAQNGPVFGFIELEQQVNEIVKNAFLTGGYRDVLP